MVMLNDILQGIGGFTGGLSQGLEQGVALQQRQQVVDLQKRQANLAAIDTFSQIMQPGMDPAIREAALQNIMPSLNLDPEDAEKFLKIANKLDEDTKAGLVDFLRNDPEIASGNFPLETLANQLVKDPLAAFQFVSGRGKERRQEKREDTRLEFEGERLELDKKQTESSIQQDRIRTGLQAKGLELEERRTVAAETEAEAAAQSKFFEIRKQGIESLGKAADIKNPAARKAAATQLNTLFDLGMTQDEIDTFGQDTLDEVKTRLEIEGKKIEVANAPRKNQIEIDAKEAELIQKGIEARQKGIEALTNAMKITDPVSRMTAVRLIDRNLKLGMTEQELTALEHAPEALEQVKARLEVEEKLLDIEAKRSGFGKNRTELMSFLTQRSRGEETDSMPEFIKKMSPETAKVVSDKLNSKTVTLSKGGYQTKGAIDRAQNEIADIEAAQSLLDRLTNIVEKDPEASGLLGSAARLGQKISGALSSFDPAVTESMEEIGLLLANADPATRSEVTSVLTNPNVTVAEVLEAAVRLRFARMLSESARINKDQYDVASRQVNITGLTGQRQVLTKLKTVNQIFNTFKSGKQKLLDRGTPAGVATEEDIEDDADYQQFLNEFDGTDEEE